MNLHWKDHLIEEIDLYLKELQSFKLKWKIGDIEKTVNKIYETAKSEVDKCNLIYKQLNEYIDKKTSNIDKDISESAYKNLKQDFYNDFISDINIFDYATNTELKVLAEFTKDYMKIAINSYDKTIYSLYPNLLEYLMLHGMTCNIEAYYEYIGVNKTVTHKCVDLFNNIVGKRNICLSDMFNINIETHDQIFNFGFYYDNGYKLSNKKHGKFFPLKKEFLQDLLNDLKNNNYSSLASFFSKRVNYNDKDSFEIINFVKEYQIPNDEVLIINQNYYSEKNLELKRKELEAKQSYMEEQLEINRITQEENRRYQEENRKFQAEQIKINKINQEIQQSQTKAIYDIEIANLKKELNSLPFQGQQARKNALRKQIETLERKRG